MSRVSIYIKNVRAMIDDHMKEDSSEQSKILYSTLDKIFTDLEVLNERDELECVFIPDEMEEEKYDH